MGLFISTLNIQCKMAKEIRKDLYTQAEYAKKVGKTRAWVNQKVKSEELNTLTINGATLVKTE